MGVEYQHLLNAVRSDNTHDVVAAGRSLVSILAKEPELVTIAAHPVGFGHAKILEEDDLTIRLHLWPIPAIEPQDPPWLVHRHAWPLTSYVICGAITNELYSVTRNVDGPRRLYSVGYEDNTSIMRATSERVDCIQSEAFGVGPGERYDVGSSAFHSTRAFAPEPTATIAVTGRITGDPPLVVGSSDGQGEYRFARSEFDRSRTREVLGSLR